MSRNFAASEVDTMIVESGISTGTVVDDNDSVGLPWRDSERFHGFKISNL